MRRTADLVVRNALVWTGRDDAPERGPSSIAVADGVVVALGDEAAAAVTDGDTVVVDAGGRRLVPGLIDSHIHAVRAGASYLDELDWTETFTLADAIESVRRAAAGRPEGEWITALGGWHPSQFADEKRMPTSDELTAGAPRHPVFVHPLYGHGDHAVLNRAGLAALGLDRPGAVAPDGELGRDATGAPDGTVRGLGVYQHVTRVALQPTLERQIDSSEAFFRRLASLGLTGVVDAGGIGMAPAKYRAVRALHRRGRLPIRIRLNHGAVTRGAEPDEMATWLDVLDTGLGDDMLSVLGAGEIIHLGCHDWEGMEPFPIADAPFGELVTTLRAAAERDWPLTIHAILQTSIARVLDAIEEVDREHPVAPLRWNICHAECIGPDELARVERLGIGLALQGRLAHKAGVCAERWGEDVVRHAPPLGDIVARGIPFGGGTDSTRGASYNPWLALWWFVTGESLDGGPRRDPQHRLDRATALDAYTRGSAWFSFEEHRRGTLRVGADADFAVLDRDYFTVPEAEIRTIRAELTVVAGRVAHRGEAFASETEVLVDGRGVGGERG